MFSLSFKAPSATLETEKRMTPTPHDKPIPNPRPVRYRTDDSTTDKDFHEIRLALTMLFEDEGRPVMDQTIRAACYGAADLGDLRAAGRIIASLGPRAKIGPVLACEVMDAISRLWDEYENEEVQE